MSNRSPRRLPEEIYVRRRVAAAGIILALVVLLIWGLVAFAGRGDDSAATSAASSAVVTTEDTAAEITRTSTSRTSEAEESSEASAIESESAEPAEPKDSCELADLRIEASSDRPAYPGDVQPTFYMTVANPTAADCEINLDDAELRFEVYNLETNERVWADTDCYPSVLTGDEVFPAGDERRFQAVWSRLGSAPGQCNARRDVGTGSFYLHAVIGDNPSDAYPFNLG